MESFYRKIYLRSWQIIKKSWYLLFFGIFVSALGLTGDFKALANLEINDIVSSTLVDWINIFRTFAVADITIDKLPTLLMLIGMFLFLAIILVMAIASQGALINATAANQKPTKTPDNPISDNLRVGVDHFWPLFGMNILNKLVSFVAAAGIVSPLIYLVSLNEDSALTTFLLSIIIFFIFIPLIIIVSFVTRYGASYIIIKKQRMTTAFFNAWNLFKVHWIVSLENALLMLVFTVIYAIIVISALAFVITPFLILGYIIAQISTLGFWILLTAGSLAIIIILLLATAFFGAYYTIVWTELFLELTSKRKTNSKVHRLARRHLPRLAR